MSEDIKGSATKTIQSTLNPIKSLTLNVLGGESTQGGSQCEVFSPLMDAKPVKEVMPIPVSEDPAKIHLLPVHKQRIGKRSFQIWRFSVRLVHLQNQERSFLLLSKIEAKPKIKESSKDAKSIAPADKQD